jgi:chemotaxis response regulator CheB
MVGFVSFDQEVEQYLVTAVLRPGNAPASLGGKNFPITLSNHNGNATAEASTRFAGQMSFRVIATGSSADGPESII